MTEQPDPKEIAEKLSEAQRDGLFRAFPIDGERWGVAFSTGSCSSLMRDGLATAPSDWIWPWLTPLGLQVRNHLLSEQGNG